MAHKLRHRRRVSKNQGIDVYPGASYGFLPAYQAAATLAIDFDCFHVSDREPKKQLLRSSFEFGPYTP